MNVSVGWQCIGTILLPTGLYCFKRIKKLRLGILLYVCSYVLSAVAVLTLTLSVAGNSSDLLYAFGSFLASAASLLLPMYFIRAWSIEWNKNQDKHLTH
jgi:hypothetical protein